MQKVDLLVTAPHFYTMTGEGVGYLADGAMAVDRGAIVAIGPRAQLLPQFEAAEHIDLPHHAVLPGLIDGHMHCADGVLRGLAQDTGYWMMYGLQPFANACPEEARDDGSDLIMCEALRSGTTTLGDYNFHMDHACAFMDRLGVRGNAAVMIREAVRRTYKPGELYEFDQAQGEALLQENLALYDRWHNKGDGRIRVLLGPQGADFCSRELLLRIQKLARERRTKIHMHVQQGDRETYQMVGRYGQRPIEWLKQLGYLDDSLIAVHLTDARDDEAKVVAESGASMLLCSGSIGIIDGIVPPARAFLEAGGHVGLGSDQAPGNNCHNIFNEMKLTALFNKIKYADPEVLPAWQALRMATIEGARAIGMDDLIGSLEEHKRADFIAVDLHKPTMSPVYTHPMRNIVPNLVYSARGDEVALAAVDGRVLYRDGKILTVDEEAVRQKAQKWTDVIGDNARAEFESIHGTNAVFMEQDRL